MSQLERSVWSELLRAHNRVRAVLEPKMEAVGLPLPAYSALMEVAAADAPLRVVDVAARIDLSPSRTSRLLLELERSRYVERAEGAEDGRAVFVGITPLGEEALKRGAAAYDEALHLAFGGSLSDFQLERLAGELNELRGSGR